MRPAGWRLLLATTCLAFVLLPVAAVAEPIAYTSGFDTSNAEETLYRIDLASGQATRVGPIGFVDVDGLAFAPDGTLYGVADGSAVGGALTDLLIRIDALTGAGTLVGPLPGLAGLGTGLNGNLDYGLAATCDGRLWMSSDVSALLWEVNADSGAVRQVGSTGRRISGLAALGSQLYGIGVQADEGLYRIDTTTGNAQRIGSLRVPHTLYDAGLDFDETGNLWATLDYLVPPDGDELVLRNDIAKIDLITGAAPIVSSVVGVGSGLSTVQMEGMAIAQAHCRGTPVTPGAPPALAEPANVPAGSVPFNLLLLLSALALAYRFRPR